MRKPDGTASTLTEAYVARPLEPVSHSVARSRSTTPLGGSVATPARRTPTQLSNRDPLTATSEETPTSGDNMETLKPDKESAAPKTTMRAHSAAVQVRLDAAG